jgi:hypothetical protein
MQEEVVNRVLEGEWMCAKQLFPRALALKHTPEEKYPACEWQRHNLNGLQDRQLFLK